MGMNHLFEACTGNLQSVREALRGGAERIELCAALPLGGLTPSLGMVRAVREMAPRPALCVAPFSLMATLISLPWRG